MADTETMPFNDDDVQLGAAALAARLRKPVLPIHRDEARVVLQALTWSGTWVRGGVARRRLGELAEVVAGHADRVGGLPDTVDAARAKAEYAATLRELAGELTRVAANLGTPEVVGDGG